MSRTFERIAPSVTSSEKTKIKKQTAIYKGLVDQSRSRSNYPNASSSQWIRKQNPNFVITSGVNESGTSTEAGCVKAAHSYELLLDVSKGKAHNNPILDGNIVGNKSSWVGTFLTYQGGLSDQIISTELTANGQIKLSETGGVPLPVPPEPYIYWSSTSPWNVTNYPGYLIGKNYVTKPCDSKDNDSNTTIDYKWSQTYWDITKSNQLQSLRYPQKIILNQQPTDLSTIRIQKTAPQPLMDTINNSEEQLERFCKSGN